MRNAEQTGLRMVRLHVTVSPVQREGGVNMDLNIYLRKKSMIFLIHIGKTAERI